MSTVPTNSMGVGEAIVSDAQRTQFHDEGYMILENVIPPEHLQMLREECSYFLGYQDAMMDGRKASVEGITHRGRRYFIANRYRQSFRLWRFIYSSYMAAIARAALGDDVYLFNEQWVVKGPEQGMKFAWHQDSGYVKHNDAATNHKPYLTCWCTLDDVSQANGTVFILPHSIAGTRGRMLGHTHESGSNDLVGYEGDHPGIAVEAAAGSVVAFSSLTLHRSGANATPELRRIYLAQYSSEPIVNSQTGEMWAQATPFVRDGRVVYDKDADFAGAGVTPL